MIKKQFTLYLENRPGVLASVTSRLAKGKVNIEGISVAESTDVAIVQIVVDSAAKARRELAKARIPHTVQDVALVHLRNEPGALFRITAELAKAKVNINYIYATASSCKTGCECYAVIGAQDLKKVEAAWKKAFGT